MSPILRSISVALVLAVPLAAEAVNPRLVVTADEVEALRAKVDTPRGEQVMLRLRIAEATPVESQEETKEAIYKLVAPAAQYLLTGDEARADHAGERLQIEFVASPIEGRRSVLERASRVLAAAYVYDFAAPAWEEARRTRIARGIERHALDLLSLRDGQAPADPLQAVVLGAVGTAMMAIEGHSADEALRARTLERCARDIRTHLRETISDQGFSSHGEGLKQMAMASGLLPFLRAYSNVHGEPLLDHPGLGRLLAAAVAQSVPEAGTLRLGPSGTSLDRSGLFAMGWRLADPATHGGILWLFDSLEGGEHLDIARPHHAVFALLDLPEDLTPGDPGEALRRTLHDEGTGLSLFRSGWSGESDIVAGLFLHASPGGKPDPGQAGNLRIYGPGARWAGSWGPHMTTRWSPDWARQANTFLPAPELYRIGGDVTVLHRDEEGLTYRLNGHAERKQAEIRVRRETIPVPEGGDFTLTRALGADWSGKAGVPGLIVIADRYEGPDIEVNWVMHYEALLPAVDLPMEAQRTEANRRMDELSRQLRTREITPEAFADRRQELIDWDRERQRGIRGARVPTRPFRLQGPEGEVFALHAHGEGAQVEVAHNVPVWRAVRVRGATDLLTVITIQPEGEPPRVRFDGEGSSATVRVGDRTARFDGTRIVFGD